MVGVPGKSKGCSTCRRRKKGCDQKRPSCGQCAASGYVCGGYQRDLTFVLHPASKTVEKAVFLPSKPRPLFLANTASLERSAVVAQCQSLFYDVYLPHGRCMVNDQFITKCGRPVNWTNVMRTMNTSETSLELAFAAFSISRVGRNKDDPRLIKESTKFYGKALKTLQKALCDPLRMNSEQVLTACLLLGLYETFEGAGGRSVGWVSHAQGAAQIIELRGPEAHADDPAHTLFLATRLPIVYSAILRRKKTFLCEDDWLTIPWRREPKSGLDRVVDIATHVPKILEQFDCIRSQMPSAEQNQALQSCLLYCRSLQKSLATWNTIRRPNSEAIVLEHESTGVDDNYPFTQELIYENHLFLNANLVFWSAALVISNTISEVEFLLASFGLDSANMLSSSASAMREAEACATKIAQSVLYCLWPDMGDLGLGYIQFPMCLAFQFFVKANNHEVCSWMLQKANEMQTKSVSSPLPPIVPSFNSPVKIDGTKYDTSGIEVTANTCMSSSPVARVEAAPVAMIELSKINTSMANTNSNTGFAAESSSEAIASAGTNTDPDFDPDYDLDSDYEYPSSASSNSDQPTVSSGRYASSHSRGNSAAKAVQGIFAESADYTFVRENPAKHYIDRSEVSMSN